MGASLKAIPGTRFHFFGKLFFLIGFTVVQVSNFGLAQSTDSANDLNVDVQPLSANVKRVLLTLDSIGYPITESKAEQINRAMEQGDSEKIQNAMSELVDLEVVIQRDLTAKFKQPKKTLRLYQNEHRPLLVKVVNLAKTRAKLEVDSKQTGAVYAGTSLFSLQRQQQTELANKQNEDQKNDVYLDLDFYRRTPLLPNLSSVGVEYCILLLHCTRSGVQKPDLRFSLATDKSDQANKKTEPKDDFSSLNLKVEKTHPTRLVIRDATQQTLHPIARIEIRDRLGRIYPNQPKRLAPDFFFQPHIYRRDGEFVYLTPGEYDVRFCRGPEYRLLEKRIRIEPKVENEIKLDLERWIDLEKKGFYSGDHHIHAAGCAHYTSPTQGVTPAHMYRQITGEGLNVGCVLTWGPCFEFQRRYFEPTANVYENRESLLKYDIEVSGFGSQALGHVCLLNLKNQTYPESEGTKTKGWPTWTTPVMRWAKKQGGFTGYAHSASGLSIDPQNASQRIFAICDMDRDGQLTKKEIGNGLLPFDFSKIDLNRNDKISRDELVAAHKKSAEQLPNYSIPEMNGVGAMEICVSAVEGVCDFISSMDTARIQEWNTWYHLLNCGFPIKVSGETDFPCMSSVRVGKGRVYVDMGGPIEEGKSLDFKKWCENLAKGRSYVSDGFAHATEFTVNGTKPGHAPVSIKSPGNVKVRFSVAFAPQTPSAVAHGTQKNPIARKVIGDTVQLHHPREHKWITGGTRKVELVVNGIPVITKTVKADGKVYTFEETVAIERSSWIAVRQFPQLHTNPVNVIVNEKPIRVSRKSALWCIGMTELLWQNRQRTIAPKERAEAQETFRRAIERFAQIAKESVPD